MKESKRSAAALILFFAAAFLCLAGIHGYVSQFIHVDGVRYAKNVTELDLSGTRLQDPEALTELTGLKRLDLRGTGLTAADYDLLRGALPGCDILWDVPFQGRFYSEQTQSLSITTLSEGDAEALRYFPRLERIYAYSCKDYAALDALRQQRPDLQISYYIRVCGRSYSYDISALSVPGSDPAALAELLPYFPRLKTLTLTEPLAGLDQILALREAFPEITITWQMDFKGVAVNEFTETLDLTGIPTTVEEIEALIPYLPNLTYVDMSDCGISNEEMDALNSRYEDIQIVWTVNLGRWYRTKTDITWFMPVKFGFYPRGNDLYNLRYCHDVIALDIGHMEISNCDFVAYMPHLKYLLLADTDISDLTPLTGLTELVYLELFLTHVTDYSPLLTLTALEDLNIHYTRGDPEIIAQMTWLKNLWWGHNDTWRIGWSTQQMLRAALPECHCEFRTTSSTGAGWRELPNYYAQRDIFGMRYMKG